MTRGGVAVRALLTAVVLSGAVASPASAHGGSGDIVPIAVEAADSGTVRVVVCVAYTDEHEASAAVELAATGPGSAAVEATAMEALDEPGLHSTVVDLDPPGSWVLTVTSTSPPAELQIPITVSELGVNGGPPGGARPGCPAVGSSADDPGDDWTGAIIGVGLITATAVVLLVTRWARRRATA